MRRIKMKTKIRQQGAQAGFSIVELMIAVAVSSVIISALTAIFINMQRSSLQQVEVSMMQQNLRGVLNILGREFRSIGMDMNGANTFNVTDIRRFSATAPGTSAVPDATPTGHPILQFTMDLNDNAQIDGNETITYLLYDRDGNPNNGLDLARTQSTAAGSNLIGDPGRQILAEGIEEIGFAFGFDVDDDGQMERRVINPGDPPSIIWAVDTTNDGNLDSELGGGFLAATVPSRQIRAVQVWILGRTARLDIKFFDQQIYSVGNRLVDPKDPAFNTQNFRHWMLTEVLHLRNY